VSFDNGCGPLALGPQPVAGLKVGELTDVRVGDEGRQPAAPTFSKRSCAPWWDA